MTNEAKVVVGNPYSTRIKARDGSIMHDGFLVIVLEGIVNAVRVADNTNSSDEQSSDYIPSHSSPDLCVLRYAPLVVPNLPWHSARPPQFVRYPK